MKLNQLVAIEKGVKSRGHAIVTKLYEVVQVHKLFSGSLKEYEKKNDEDDDLPSEEQIVQYRLTKIFSDLRIAMSGTMDIRLQTEDCNTRARADVIVDGETILQNVPVTVLMPLEKQLVDLRTFIAHLPVLDRAHRWSKDEGTGLYVTAPRRTARTKKVHDTIVLLQPTDKHPGQAEMITKDVVAGMWNMTLMSGAIPIDQKEAMAARLEKLILAVKSAREAANDLEVPEVRPTMGAAIFDYLKIGG